MDGLMMGDVYWEKVDGSDVVRVGWARGECVYEITKTGTRTRQGATLTYHLWGFDEGENRMVHIYDAPSLVLVIRAAERIEEKYLEDNPDLVFDKTDEADYVN